MKKFLSLVLALVMTMSLVTISAGAFTDDSKVNYDEAVDVISALGIVGGYTDGSFKPQGTLTRGAAAKIICNMMLGVKTASELPSIASYSDVPAGSTYAPYIAYLKNEGVVGGYADGTFRPGNTLTGYHFMKMLLGALGYDAAVEGLEGDGWQINAAKLAKKAGLYDGNKSFNGNNPATREEACLYALNTMMAETVEYDKKDVIQIGDITIKNNSEAKGTGDCFYEADFDTLAKDTSHMDALGRPAAQWTYEGVGDDDVIGTYGTEAKYSFVAKEDFANNDLADLQKALDNKKLTWNADATADYVVNGDTTASLDINAGDYVEVFCDADDANEAQRIVVVSYELYEITKVDTKVTNKTDIEDGVEAYVTLKSVTGTPITMSSVKSTEIVGYDPDVMVKGDKVLVSKNAASNQADSTKKVLEIAVPEIVEGKVNAVKTGSYKVTVDTTVYTYDSSVALSSTSISKTGKLYLDKAGRVVEAELTGASSVENFVMVYNVKRDDAKVNEDGVGVGYTYTVYTVDANGVKKSYPVKSSDTTTIAALFDDSNSYALKSDTVIVTAYEMDGSYFKTASTPSGWYVAKGDTALGKTASSTYVAKTNGSYYAGNDTQFVFAEADDDNVMKVTTATGFKTVQTDGANYYFVAEDSDIKAVFSYKDDKGAAATEEYVLGLVTDATATVTKNDDGTKTYSTYDVIIDGEATTITAKANKTMDLVKGNVYKFTMDDDKASAYAVLNDTTISAVKDDSRIYAGSSVYEVGLDTTVYTIYENYKKTGNTVEFDEYVVSSDVVLETGMKMFTFKDKDDKYTVFVVKSNLADFS